MHPHHQQRLGSGERLDDAIVATLRQRSNRAVQNECLEGSPNRSAP